MKNQALATSGIIFSIIAILHIVRYFKNIPIVVDHYNIPLSWSIYAAIVIALLAGWMFAATKD